MVKAKCSCLEGVLSFSDLYINHSKMQKQKIKDVVFDFGGVIMELDRSQAVKKFIEIGIDNAEDLIGLYHQQGVFLEVEDGTIDREGFYAKMREICGKDIPSEKMDEGWLAFITDTPQYKLDFINELRSKYKVSMLSNTNPIIMGWAKSEEFTEAGRPVDAYFDELYLSYEMKVVKPSRKIFEMMIEQSGMNPSETLFLDDGAGNIAIAKEMGFHTYQPANGEDWRHVFEHYTNE